jgi:hypothetical protein
MPSSRTVIGDPIVHASLVLSFEMVLGAMKSM